MHAIMNILLIELDFLLDDKVSAEMNNEEPKEQILIKMNVLRKVLAVKDESEMTRLLMDIYQNARQTIPFIIQEESNFPDAERVYNEQQQAQLGPDGEISYNNDPNNHGEYGEDDNRRGAQVIYT